MDYVPAYHYELQTFAEKRETNWVCGPHKVTCGALVTRPSLSHFRVWTWTAPPAAGLLYPGRWICPRVTCSRYEASVTMAFLL